MNLRTLRQFAKRRCHHLNVTDGAGSGIAGIRRIFKGTDVGAAASNTRARRSHDFVDADAGGRLITAEHPEFWKKPAAVADFRTSSAANTGPDKDSERRQREG